MRSWESRDGTCLMETRIFMKRPSAGEPLEDQASVGAAEPEGIRERILYLHGARVVRHIVEIALGVGRVEIHCGWRDLIAQRQHRDAGLQPSSPTQKVA